METKQTAMTERKKALQLIEMPSLIKVCPNPGCEAVWHNIPKSYTKCNDCGGRVMLINQKTFWNKFSNTWFQYDFETGEYLRPQKPIVQLSLDFA